MLEVFGDVIASWVCMVFVSVVCISDEHLVCVLFVWLHLLIFYMSKSSSGSSSSKSSNSSSS